MHCLDTHLKTLEFLKNVLPQLLLIGFSETPGVVQNLPAPAVHLKGQMHSSQLLLVLCGTFLRPVIEFEIDLYKVIFKGYIIIIIKKKSCSPHV